jgi:membrane-bound lytic murein transglycosylase D
VIESALNPVARSSAGAKGLWQFMYGTGKMYDLQVNSYKDDRSDPYKATAAACQHLKDLYAIYNDWALVLAAYNSGAGNVNKAIRRSGGIMDFWTIMRYLPKETRDYVPAFIAVNYVMNYSVEHNLYPVYPGIVAAEIDTVTVKNFLTFEQLSEVFNIPIENIRYLNPAYSKDLIPASAENSFVLRLPKQYIIDFINNEQAIYAYKTQKVLDKEKMMAMIKDFRGTTTLHTVRKGETLASIAQKYNVSTEDLRKWNNMRRVSVKPRQELLVYIKSRKQGKQEAGETADSALAKTEGTTSPDAVNQAATDSVSVVKVEEPISTEKPSLKGDNSKFVYHTIRQGDTLWDIAAKYKATVEQIKVLNNIKNANSLKPGQKIKVGTAG